MHVHKLSQSSGSLQQWVSLISRPEAGDIGTNQQKQLLLLCVLSMNTCSVLVCQFVFKLPSQSRVEEVVKGQRV